MQVINNYKRLCSHNMDTFRKSMNIRGPFQTWQLINPYFLELVIGLSLLNTI